MRRRKLAPAAAFRKLINSMTKAERKLLADYLARKIIADLRRAHAR